MTATFNRRLEQGALFTQVVLGLAVFAHVAGVKAVGAALAIIPVWLFIYRPGPKALLASQQQRRYESLCVKMSSMSDEELALEFSRISGQDSEPADFICKAAENALHINAKCEPPHTLGVMQKCMRLIAGS